MSQLAAGEYVLTREGGLAESQVQVNGPREPLVAKAIFDSVHPSKRRC